MKHKTVGWYVYSAGESMLQGTEGRDSEEAVNAFMERHPGMTWEHMAKRLGYTVRRVTVEWES